MNLLNGDCLDLLKDIAPKSVDLVFCDLPYGQTCCNWDNKIDLTALWIELKRVAKPKTPFFFTCSTKFGYELIKSNEKWFRYDLVWEKTAPVGFLYAKKMPMRKHEMVYVFYDKLPLYDINSHTHKFHDDTIKFNMQLKTHSSTYDNFKRNTIKKQGQTILRPTIADINTHYKQ